MLEELNRIQITVAAIAVRNPFALLSAVVEIQHRGNRIHAQSVDMIFVIPEQRIADQEVLHFILRIIKDLRAPVRVLPHAGISIFIRRRTIEIREAERIFRKMRGHPVQNHADAMLVQIVDQILEAQRRAVTAGRRIISGYLIAPGAIERMFGNSHELHMRIAHPATVFHELFCIFFIREKAVLIRRILLLPAAEVAFIDGQRIAERILLCPFFHPGSVVPLIAVDIRGAAGIARPQFRSECIRICLVQNVSGLCLNGILV